MIAARCLLWSVMTGVLLLAHATTADAQETDGPVLIRPPKSEIILQSGQNYSMLCQGSRPIQFQQQEIYEDNTGQFFIEQSNGTLENGDRYWVTLDLYNVDQFAVGYYACFDDTIDTKELLHNIVEEPNNTQHVTYTYVYVNGSTLFAPMRTLVVAKSDSKFLVDCKPTSPDIKVNLIGSNKTPDSVKYTPKIGFIFSKTPKRNFVCELRRGNEISPIHISNYLKSVVPQPTITGGQQYFLTGETFWMNCTVEVPQNVAVALKWNCPEKCPEDVDTNSHNIPESNTYYRNILIKNAKKNNAGIYTCEAVYQGKTNKSSFEKRHLDEAILDVKKTGRSDERIEAYLTKTKVLRITFRVEAYPRANFTVIRDNITLQDGIKYEISSKDMFTFKINSLSAEDTGNYVFNFSNGYKEKIIHYYIEVFAKPEIYYNIWKPYVKRTLATVKCTAIGYPLPEVQWIFIDDDGNTSSLVQDQIINITNEIKSAARIESKLTLPVKVSGDIMCIASNRMGSTNVTKKFLIYEIDGGFGIENAEKMWFPEHESVTLKCLASLYNFSNVTWSDEDGKELNSVEWHETKYSLIAEFKMAPITVQQAGLYICKGTNTNGTEITQNVTVTVAKNKLPVIIGSLDETKEIDQAEKVKISCVADAIPPPKITWLKDDYPIEFDDNIIKNEEVHLNRTTVNSTIDILFMRTDFAGKYECIVTSQNNKEIKTVKLMVKEAPSNKTLLMSITGAIFFALIVVVLYLVWKIRKEKQFRKELAAAGLLYFKEGVTKSINPDLGIDEQAELLPYNDKFEFPVEKLKLGKQLGAGAFGVVYKAEARGIINAEESTTVAVKMVKKTADNMYIKALASELKIMVHLGKHINIVNLLGACTKHVGKRELIVIVEYCKFGNIHNYLIKHREVYIDQLNDNPEKSLGKVNRGYSCSSGNSAVNSDYFGSNHTQDTDHTFLNTANTNRSARKDKQNLKETQNKQMELTKVSESGYVQPEWRSNYESDYSFDGRSPRPLCSRDLLAWSFQIARGMEYLASRKILHGDLAARNILLAEDNVVKICDFGLARSIYKNDEYQKKENSPLPVKWLAIECMTDRIFTTQSDVWSFGIVLWELFSLAKTPYPNISPKDLLQYLSEGHRLHKPAYADDKLYNVMKQCWQQKPIARPSFTQLQELLGSFLEDNVRNHYVDLNATYMDMNVKNEGEEDYLAMVSAPDYNKMVTPSPHHYINEPRQFFPPTPTPLLHDDEGYLQMSPASRQTFNARPQGTKFDFDARKLTPRGSDANSYGSESTPMLTLNNLPRSGSESDQEGNAPPYMHTTPKIPEETDDDVFKENNTKNIQSNQVTNPSYIMFTNVDEKKPQNFANNYINVNVPNGIVK